MLIYHDCLTRQVLALWLRAAGYDVELLPCVGADALLEGKTAPNLILLDYDLPHGCGPDVLADLRSVEHLRGVPIVALSADGPPNGSSADGALASAWLAKPCDVGDLSVWLVRLLGSPLAPYTGR